MWAPLLRYKITLDMQTTFGWPTSKLQGFGKPKPVEHLSTGGHHTNTLHCCFVPTGASGYMSVFSSAC